MGRIVPMNQTALRHMRKKERHGRSFLWIRMNRQRVSTGYAELNIYNRLYNKDNLLVYEKQVKAMAEEQRDCRIPKALIPRCPVCGKEMEVNLRKDGFFVEDEKWHQAAGRYERFLGENRNKHILFLELGVGMNTPGIIKFPFWKLCAQLVQTSYVCINQGEAWAPEEIRNRSLCINGDIAEVLRDLEDEKNGSAAEA